MWTFCLEKNFQVNPPSRLGPHPPPQNERSVFPHAHGRLGQTPATKAGGSAAGPVVHAGLTHSEGDEGQDQGGRAAEKSPLPGVSRSRAARIPASSGRSPRPGGQPFPPARLLPSDAGGCKEGGGMRTRFLREATSLPHGSASLHLPPRKLC